MLTSVYIWSAVERLFSLINDSVSEIAELTVQIPLCAVHLE